MMLQFSGESVQSIMGATDSCMSNILILFSFYFSVRPIGSEQPNKEHDGSVDDIAAMVAFVAGPEASYITGASLTVDGGTNA
jgi:NAD(P)-dependent dehydrogenase (short-subunit alcohol dehydrogenase family)